MSQQVLKDDLEVLHSKLDAELTELMLGPCPDNVAVSTIKRKKLDLKDQMWGFKNLSTTH
jgi:hypothetical protein